MFARPTRDPHALFAAAVGGDRVALARLLTLVERGGAASRTVAALAYRGGGDAYTIGITGAPGAGKSTLTDRLIGAARRRGIRQLGPAGGSEGPAGGSEGPAGGSEGPAGGSEGPADEGHDVAVLAIDPSSPFTGGAILGDRVRMQGHALDEHVFIRSMATRGHLGGLAVAVPDAVRVLSAVGLPVVLVETVGVGQVEVGVAGAADTTLVVVNPGWGDAVQANKAGLLEIADCFVINKADRPGVKETRRDLELMLDLTAPGDWRPPVVETVAASGEGTDELWDAVERHRAHLVTSGQLEVRRHQRVVHELEQVLLARLRERVGELRAGASFADLADELLAGSVDPYEAADRLLDAVAPAGD
jgi:LAO/AO transport system kinase